MDLLEGRNPVIEALTRQRRRVRRIWLDQGAKPDERVAKLIALAEGLGVPLVRVARAELDRRSDGRVHQGVVAEADPLPDISARALIEGVLDRGEDLFLLLVAEVQYEHNLGALLRTALGFGAHGIVVPTRRGAGLTPVVQRVAMGAAEVVPVVHESLFSALKVLRDAGVPSVAADMDGDPIGAARLTGSVALVLGGEGSGVSPTMRRHVDRIVSIPLAGSLESLNVSVAGAVLMYEKRRQDGWFNRPG
jgi:23S rRNA (guanosine2251-2'-O)-methyltransferase